MSWSNNGGRQERPPARAVRTTVLKGVYLYLPYDAGYVAWIKDHVPAGQRTWEADEKRWWIAETYADGAVKMARTVFPLLDTSAYDGKGQQRPHEDYRQAGFGGNARQQTQRQEAPASGPHAILFLLPSAPAEVVNAAYKALAKVYHPDAGTRPDTLRMTAINNALDELKKAGKV